jgi:hypothetical protein
VLHHYEAAAGLVADFRALLTSGGGLYLTSLVLSRRLIGDLYLRALHRKRWIVRPRREAEFRSILQGSLGPDVDCRTVGNMAYATAAALPRPTQA